MYLAPSLMLETCSYLDIFPLLQGRFKYQPGQVRAFGMIAGGSGITPMFQVYIEVSISISFSEIFLVHFSSCSTDYNQPVN